MTAIAKFGPVGKGEQLVYNDTGNKILGPLSASPTTPEDVSLFAITGAVQQYTSDYTVRLVVGGSAPGYYICISTSSSAPGGGSFLGGSNPGTGIDSVLAFGDTVRILYPV